MPAAQPPSSARTRRAAGWARAVHPFPSALDALTCGALALIAGATPGRVALLAGAMLALQFSIGLLNDVADAAADAAAGRLAKPVAAGLIARGTARAAAVLFGATGLALALGAGLGAAVIAAVGYAAGLVYDLRLKRTPWSFAPYAVGIPLLPVFAWVGATGTLPGRLLLLAALAMPAGAALAMSNALADLGVDHRAGVVTVAGRVGRSGGLRLVAALLAGVAAVALATTIQTGSVAGSLLVLGGAAVTAAGVALSAAGRARRGWEVQAIGLALTATGWVAASAAAGLLG